MILIVATSILHDVFKIINDPYGILEETSVYYNFRGGYNFD